VVCVGADCSGSGGTSVCLRDDHCGRGQYCLGAECRARAPRGAACSGDFLCASRRCGRGGTCVDCRRHRDCPRGDVCSARGACSTPPPSCRYHSCPPGYGCKRGRCVREPAPPPCLKDQQCPAGSYCLHASCRPLLSPGRFCSRPAQCRSGSCQLPEPPAARSLQPVPLALPFSKRCVSGR